MRLLDAVNLIMPKLGERPVTSLAVPHPTISVLLPIMDRVRKDVLLEEGGWWFNKYEYTALPDTFGVITLGQDTLSFVPEVPDTAILRGNTLFNPVTLTTQFSAGVRGTVTSDVDFESLPESAATYVMYSALIIVSATDLGMTAESQVWQALAARAHSSLVAEHLRQRKASTRKQRAWQSLRRAMNS